MLKPSFRLYKNLPKEEREAKGITSSANEVSTGKLDIQTISIEVNERSKSG
jgi:hypothetical protein